jgi:putative oxidoreductase
MIIKLIISLSRFFLGLLFIWAGISKIIDPINFSRNIHNYRLFSINISFIIAIILPWIELICGLCLVFGVRIKSSSLLISSVLTLFILIILITMSRGINVDCGCFGKESGTVDWKLLIQDITLLIMSILTFKFDRGWLSIEKLLRKIITINAFI